jgi:hypothetical protein
MKTAAVLLLSVLAMGAARATDAPLIEVWKSPTCGCCGAWVDHLKDAGFRVQVNNAADMSVIKQRFKVPPELSSCHTGLVRGQVVEGHVPAADIFRLLRQSPQSPPAAAAASAGLFVPGMPAGSPGMESPNPEAYKVVAQDAQGKRTVFATHGP